MDDIVERLREVNSEAAPYANPVVLTRCHQAADEIDALRAENAKLRETMRHTARVLSDWHKTDFNEIVADGGVTASDVIRQECGWHAARINTAIANAERKP